MLQVVLASRARQSVLWRTHCTKLRDGRVPGMSAVEELRSQWLQHRDVEKEGGGKEGMGSI